VVIHDFDLVRVALSFCFFSLNSSSEDLLMTADTPPRKLDTQELRDTHALAIGRIVIAWNEFQENLGQIFASLFDRADYRSALVAWHALENDRAQREMIRAVAKLKLGSESKAFREINWLLEQANQQLSNQRNFGIHTPLIVHWDNRDNNIPLESALSIIPLDMLRGGPGCLNSFSASMSGASAGVRLPSGEAAG